MLFDSESIRQYASTSGDTSPLHHDIEHARRSRFGCLIACGAHSTGLMMSAVAHFLSERGGALGLEFSFQLRKAISAESRLQLTWTVTNVQEKATLNGHIITLDGRLCDAERTVFVIGNGKALAALGDNVI